MKEVAKKHRHRLATEGRELLNEILKQLLFLCFGFAAAKTEILGGMKPFGVSFCAAATPKYSVFCFLGVALGYVFPTDNSSFMYIACGAAVSAIRLIATKYLGKKASRSWVFCSAALLIFLTGAITKGSTLSGILILLTEALIAGVAAYFAGLCLEPSKNQYALLFTGTVLLTGLMSFSFAGINLGIITAAVFICLAGEYGGVNSGAVAGTFCGIAHLLSSGELLPPLVLVLSSLAAGFCAALGRLAVTSAVILAAICTVVGVGFPLSSVATLTSLLIGGGIYVIMPRSITSKCAALFRRPADTDTAFGVRRNIEMKLGFTADALRKINEIVNEVSEKLSETDRPAFERVLAGTKREACAGCSFSDCCWKLEKRETERAMKEMAKSVRNQKPLGLTELSTTFEIRCPRKERVENAIMKFYARYQNESSRDSTARQVRNALNDQFSAISEMLDNAAEDIKSGEIYNPALAKSVSGVLSGLGLGVKRCCCIQDSAEKMRIEVVLEDAPEAPVSRAKMREAISEICGRDFAAPEITRADKEYLLTLCERTELEVEYASYSIKSDSCKICGDNAEQFLDGKGNSYMIISDGMGTGTRAAIDSRMATSLSSRLIGAGFDFSPMLKLINTAMMYRSGEESLATLDIAEINLYTGEVSLYKAGSAPTLIRKSSRVVKAECHSLPLGILRNVEFHKVCSKLSAGDIILMMSDGATLDGTDWIANELECFEGSAKALCELIANEAKRRRLDGHSDDITVSAAIILKQI